MEIFNNKFKDYDIILASASPRRKELLKGLNIEFTTATVDKGFEELYPSNLKSYEIPLYLAEKKASSFKNIADSQLLITADTIVWSDNKVLEKPKNKEQAIKILSELSGKQHLVITGVCIRLAKHKKSFYSETKVFFSELSNSEIEYYVNNYKPYDKAGAYGIQEWIGMIGINKIEGSFYNVVGLPVQKLYRELLNWDVIGQ